MVRAACKGSAEASTLRQRPAPAPRRRNGLRRSPGTVDLAPRRCRTSRRAAGTPRRRGASVDGAAARDRPIVEPDALRRARAAASERGAIGKTSLTRRGQASADRSRRRARRPGAAPRHWRAARASAKARRRDRPPSARRGSGPSTASGRRACADRAKFARLLGIEEDHRLAGQRAVLGRAERQGVDAGPPRDICAGEQPSRDQRIGEARAVHMHREARLVGDRRQRGDLVERNRPCPLRSPGESDSAPGCADLTRPRGKRASVSRSAVGRDLAAFAGDADELGAAGEEFRRAAFVVVDMRFLVAEDRAPRRRQRGERQGVGGGAGRDQKRRDRAARKPRSRRLARAAYARRRHRPAPFPRSPRRSRRESPAPRRPRCRSQNSSVALPRIARPSLSPQSRSARKPVRSPTGQRSTGEKICSRSRAATCAAPLILSWSRKIGQLC